MDILNFTFKLLKHGGIFLLRVVGIVAPVIAGAISSALSKGNGETTEKTVWTKYHEAPYEVLPDGSHQYHDEY
jgi:hypothetical protein